MEAGAVKTFFNGQVTQDQLIGIGVMVLVVMVVLALAKKIMKVALLAVALIGGLVYFNVMSPAQLMDASKVLQEKGMEAFQQAQAASQNVRIDNSGGTPSISVNVGGNWVNVNDITGYVKAASGAYSVNVGGQDFAVTDTGVMQILDMLRK